MTAAGAVLLPDARDERAFGGKATQLAVAVAAGLPVPPGVALSAGLVEAVAAGEAGAAAEVRDAAGQLAPPLAVRSSAIGEDSAEVSFAGQHTTRLGVPARSVVEAVAAVFASAWTEAALAYRRRLGVEGEPRTGVVIQSLLPADVAGVLFTRDPVTGSDERVIEASWGLGPAVVNGLVIPDRYRIARGGAVLERVLGHKDLMIQALPNGETVQRRVSPERAAAACLDPSQLTALDQLASACEQLFGNERDIEFAFASGTLYLLQCRPLTR